MHKQGAIPSISAIVALTLLSIIAMTLPALAASVHVTVKPGPLTVDFPFNPALSAVDTNGFDQVATGTLGLFDIRDARGTGDGWNLILSASDFVNQTDPTRTISSSTFNVTPAPPVVRMAGNSPPQSYKGSLAPALKLLTASADTGMGNFQIEPSVNLSVPADSFAGTYDSTLTLTLTTGP